LFLLIVVLFGFLNIKSVKIYAIPYIFSTTLLLYKLDTLLLKQKNLPVLDITGFFFRIRTSAFTWVLMRKKKPVISNTVHFFCFNSTVSYTCTGHQVLNIFIITVSLNRQWKFISVLNVLYYWNKRAALDIINYGFLFSTWVLRWRPM
jgi:hypothetical protein